MASSSSTRQFYGFDFGTISAVGGARPPFIDAHLNGTGNYISLLSSAKAVGAALSVKFTGRSEDLRTSDNKFAISNWTAKMEAAFNKFGSSAASRSAISAQLAAFVRDGTLLCNLMIDDFKSGTLTFSGGSWPTYQDIEDMAAYSKAVWPGVPCFVRADNGYMETRIPARPSVVSYHFLDAGWAMWETRLGSAQNYFTNHVNSGKRTKIGAMCAFNDVNGGSGTDPAWRFHPSDPNKFGMSPAELDECRAAYVQVRADVVGIIGWTANPNFDVNNYYDNPQINAAFTGIANAAIGRVRGPLNYHTSSATTSSGGTLVGDWAQTHTVRNQRGSGVQQTALLPTPATAGELWLMTTYSRDSIQRSIVTPSTWSLAKKVSGSSGRGGELALWYKICQGNEASTQVLDFTGTGGGGTVTLISTVAFSGNTSNLIGLLGTVGSAGTWSHGTSNMGPVPGLTPTSEANLAVIVAAKVNDFDQLNDPAGTVMSSTTADGETWTRAFIAATETGSDLGIFMDYAPLTGNPSITTKSWTQTTASNSSSSGAGVGFMVTFVAANEDSSTGEPPIISEQVDFTQSVSSTVSLTLDASGTAPITWSLATGPSNVTLGSSTGLFVWTPLSIGSFLIQVQAVNSFGTDTESFTAFIVASSTSTSGASVSNSTPVITHPGNPSVQVGQRLTFVIVATDPDGDPIEYSLDETSPAGASLNPFTGLFDWTPTGDQGPNTYALVALVTDGQHESASTFTVTVLDSPWTKLANSNRNGFVRF